MSRTSAKSQKQNQPLKYMISADFGQTVDYTAVAVTERRLVPLGPKYTFDGTRWEGSVYHPEWVGFSETRQDVAQHYDLIRLDRVQRHTPYTQIGKGLIKLVQEFYAVHTRRDDYHGGEVQVGLAFDEGGVGKAVKDILIEAAENAKLERGKPKVRFLPVAAHGGFNTNIERGFWHVPKRDIITAGQRIYQEGRLRVPENRGVNEERWR